MFKISVMDYTSALRYAYDHTEEDDERYAIVSIQEVPYEDMSITYKISKNCKAVLNLWFSDISRMKDESLEKSVKLMTEEDAVKIKKFVDSIWDTDLDRLIIHCYGGVSRSAAVAAAISRVKFKDDSIYFNGGYIPNMFVYNKVLEAYGFSNKPSKL